MDFELSQTQRLIKEQITRFAQQELGADVVERDRLSEFPRDLWRRCGEMGLPGLPVPEEYGGAGHDPLTTAVAFEALGYGAGDRGLVFSLAAHLFACVVPIWKHGTEAQKRVYLPRLCSGELIAVNGLTEQESGSDAFSMRTTASPDGDGYRIDGTKAFGTNGPLADIALIYARTDGGKGYHGGITAFIVESSAPGFSCGQRYEKMGLRTSPIGELVCEGVHVSADQVLGGVGAGAAIFTESMNWERTCLVAGHVGLMEQLLDRAVEHARNRRSFGKPIGKNQAVSHKIAEMKVRLEAARLLTNRSAWGLERGRDSTLHASITKLFTSEALVRSARDTLQILGGYGYMTEAEVERALRDALASTIYSGTSEMQRDIIARWLGL